ncbi:hypothetical protein BC567DRAFT_209222 [Phyllosticta citribraziliensis]
MAMSCLSLRAAGCGTVPHDPGYHVRMDEEVGLAGGIHFFAHFASRSAMLSAAFSGAGRRRLRGPSEAAKAMRKVDPGTAAGWRSLMAGYGTALCWWYIPRRHYTFRPPVQLRLELKGASFSQGTRRVDPGTTAGWRSLMAGHSMVSCWWYISQSALALRSVFSDVVCSFLLAAPPLLRRKPKRLEFESWRATIRALACIVIKDYARDDTLRAKAKASTSQNLKLDKASSMLEGAFGRRAGMPERWACFTRIGRLWLWYIFIHNGKAPKPYVLYGPSTLQPLSLPPTWLFKHITMAHWLLFVAIAIAVYRPWGCYEEETQDGAEQHASPKRGSWLCFGMRFQPSFSVLGVPFCCSRIQRPDGIADTSMTASTRRCIGGGDQRHQVAEDNVDILLVSEDESYTTIIRGNFDNHLEDLTPCDEPFESANTGLVVWLAGIFEVYIALPWPVMKTLDSQPLSILPHHSSPVACRPLYVAIRPPSSSIPFLTTAEGPSHCPCGLVIPAIWQMQTVEDLGGEDLYVANLDHARRSEQGSSLDALKDRQLPQGHMRGAPNPLAVPQPKTFLSLVSLELKKQKLDKLVDQLVLLWFRYALFLRLRQW